MSFHTPAEKQTRTDTESPVSPGILERKGDGNRETFANGKSIDIHSLGNSFDPASIGTNSASRFGRDLSGVKLHADELSPTLPTRTAPLMVQRFPDNTEEGSAPTSAAAEPGSETAPASGEIEPVEETAAPGETPAAALIVEDSAEELGPGQMRKSEFLEQLRAEVCRTVNAALAGTGRDTEGCPYLDYWFEFYGRKDSAHIERAIHSYAPETASVTTAGDYIPIITERARQAAETWARTGELTGVPEGIPTNLPGEPPKQDGEESSASTCPVMTKARDGGSKTAHDPQAIQKELGEGRPLEGSVRSHMESAFGMDFSHVRTHTDTTAAGLSDSLNARAFTVGEHVAFGAGEYQPGTMIGDALMAHELAHVVQQGGSNSLAAKLQESTGYNALEEDADISAVGAVASLWSGTKGKFVDFAQNAVPRLRSGLRLQRCDGDGCGTRTTTTTTTPISPIGIKSVTNADGKGWLTVKHANGSDFPPLPQYLKVDHTSTSGGRENFTIKESGQNGTLIGGTASVKQKSSTESYLSNTMTYKGAASTTFDKGKGEFRYGSSGPVTVITDTSNPTPNGTHDLEIPYEQHPHGSNYESSSIYAKTWFRIGQSGDRFLHPGRISAGCTTITAVSDWTSIYEYLINSRKDDKSVGTITVT
jgi:hypothetical protein